MENENVNEKLNREQAEQLFRQYSNPKIRQRIDVLQIDDAFQKDVVALREKWADKIKIFNDHLKPFTDEMDKMFEGITTLDQEGLEKLKTRATALSTQSLTKEDIKEFEDYSYELYEPLQDVGFNKDVVELCEKYNLLPTSLWKHCVQLYITTGDFAPPTPWFGTGLESHASNKEMMGLPPDLNFGIFIEENRETLESELFIQVFENTSLADIKEHWDVINTYQKKLRDEKGITKRDYTLKNLDNYKKLKALDKNDTDSQYDPVTNTWDAQKMTDAEKAKRIYGGKITKKVKDVLKQMRYQFDKRRKK